MKTILSIITVLALAAFSFGEQQADVLSVKSGKAKFMVLQPDTNKGIRNAPLGFVNANDRSQRQNVVTDENGLAVVDLAVGRYVLELGKEPITILDASVDGQLEEIRLMPERLAVGGQDTTDWRPVGSSSGTTSGSSGWSSVGSGTTSGATSSGWTSTGSTSGATESGWNYVGGSSGSHGGAVHSGSTHTHSGAVHSGSGHSSGATSYSGDWRSLGEARVVSESELQTMGAIKTSGALSGQTYTDGSVSYGEWQSVGGGTYTEAAPVVSEGWGYVSEGATTVTEVAAPAPYTGVAWAGAGEACLVNQDGVDYVETAAGLVAIADGSYNEDASGNYVQGADGVWWKIADCETGAVAKGKKKPLLILAAGVIAAIIIADNVSSDDDDAAAPVADTTPVTPTETSSGGSSSAAAVVSAPAAASPTVVEEVVTRSRTRRVIVGGGGGVSP